MYLLNKMGILNVMIQEKGINDKNQCSETRVPTPVAMSTSGTQTPASKNHSPLKDTSVP